MAKDKFLIEICSPKDVVTDTGGNTREEAEAALRKMKNEGWVPIGIKKNPKR
jgi:predicted RNase H-like HicB family nuclease